MKFSFLSRFGLAGFAVAASSAAVLAAGPTVFNSEVNFTSNVASASTTTITFDNIAASGGYKDYSTGSPLKIGGITFQGQSVETKNGIAQNPVGVSYIKDSAETGGVYQVNGSDSYLGGGTYTANASDVFNGTVTLTFDQAYTAFGTQIATNKDAAQTVQISLYNGNTLITSTPTTLNLAYNPTAPQFIGYTSAQAFNKVVIKGTAGSYLGSNSSSYIGSFTLLDNVRVANAVGAVPEPGVMVSTLSLVSMTGLGLVRGRKRSAKAA